MKELVKVLGGSQVAEHTIRLRILKVLDWERGVLQRAGFDPTLLYVALDGAKIVGTIICRTGYVQQLAVLRAWRRQGIALHLLRTVFKEHHQRGRNHVQLSVHLHNRTGAYQCYERAGMQKKRQIDIMQKTLSQ